MKKIYFTKDLEGLHTMFKSMIENPPNDYIFLTPNLPIDKIENYIIKKKMAKLLGLAQPYFWFILGSMGWFLHDPLRSVPSGTELIFSPFGGLVYKKIPWVVAVDDVFALSYYDYKHSNSRFYQLMVKRALSSCYCKKIMPWCDFVKDRLFSQYDCKKFKDKIETVYPAIPSKKFKKSYNKSKIKLLFCGSNRYGGFHLKGGKEILEAFSILNDRYSGLELTIRSRLPPDVKYRYSKILRLPNVEILEKIISREKLDSIYRFSDILLAPSIAGAPAMVPLEGMRFGLPIITMYGGLSSEIQNLGTGFVIKISEKPPNDAKKYHYYLVNASKDIKPEIAEGLVDKTSILIEDDSLRRKMGEKGRKEIANGKFSIKKRNRKLKRIFEDAIKK